MALCLPNRQTDPNYIHITHINRKIFVVKSILTERLQSTAILFYSQWVLLLSFYFLLNIPGNRPFGLVYDKNLVCFICLYHRTAGFGNCLKIKFYLLMCSTSSM